VSADAWPWPAVSRPGLLDPETDGSPPLRHREARRIQDAEHPLRAYAKYLIFAPRFKITGCDLVLGDGHAIMRFFSARIRRPATPGYTTAPCDILRRKGPWCRDPGTCHPPTVSYLVKDLYATGSDATPTLPSGSSRIRPPVNLLPTRPAHRESASNRPYHAPVTDQVTGAISDCRFLIADLAIRPWDNFRWGDILRARSL